jgi:glycosyltransferase involved in cell wall biosynthesis
LNVTDSVIWAGDVESMPDAYAAADVVVNTSSRPEPFGRTMAEGMAAGKPVVAFAEGGAVDIVLDNETGFLIPPYDTDKLTAELLKLHDDEKLRHDFGETGRERAHELFDRTGLGEKVRRVCMGEE